MRGPYVQLYVHLVWATWDRLPSLDEDIRTLVYSCVASECRRLGAHPIAIGGIDEHVHLLAGMPATLAVATLAKQVKGASSYLVNKQLPASKVFRWQGGYGAFSIGRSQLEKVKAYVLRQEEHHCNGQLYAALELTEEKLPGG